MSDALSEARGLIDFIDASPSPYHAVSTVAARLDALDFRRLDERAAWPRPTGRAYVVRGGSLVAWAEPPGEPPARGFRIIGAHTDSPNLRLKPQPDAGSVGYRQLGVEVYGGALYNSWLDRDLGLSGRVSLRDGPGTTTRLLRVDRPLARVPQLAIHLDRGVNENGLKLNPQEHLTPMWSLGPLDEGGFRCFLADELATGAEDIMGWDLMLHDVNPSTLLGVDDEFVSAPRIDNLASCFAGLRAMELVLSHATATDEAERHVPVLCMFDHEEIGSQSASGADSTILPTVLERVMLAGGGDREQFHRALAGSTCVSADGAHATHPNYPERNEPAHRIQINGGPVLKVNSNLRYATDAESAATLALACERAQVPLQRFVTRADMPCGSTIGPVTASRLGIATVDMGMPQLAMHSAREICGSSDPALFIKALRAFLEL